MALPHYHLYPEEKLAEVRVSSRSMWHDDVWEFDNHTAGQRKEDSSIRWDTPLSKGLTLMSPEWSDLREGLRRFAWSLHVAHCGGANYKPGSFGRLHSQTTYFVNWMDENLYYSLGELNATSFDEYFRHVIYEKIIQSKGDEPVTAVQLLRYLTLPYLLWIQAPELRKAHVEAPTAPPYNGQTAFSMAKELAEDIRGKVPPLPDETFIMAMTKSLSILDDGDVITNAFHSYCSQAPKFVGRSQKFRSRIVDRIISEASAHCSDAILYFDGGASDAIRRSVDILRDACTVLLQGGVGLRVSELCGLVADPVRDGLPACITVRPSNSGLHEIFYVTGRVYKGENTWSEHEWVAGVRPVGTSYLPLTIRAVQSLERLFRKARSETGINRLILQFNTGKGVYFESSFRLPTTDTVNLAQKKFFLNKLKILDWDVSTSQWRKTFAQFVVRTDARLMAPLRDHFHHISMAMTEQGYAAADPEFRQVLDDAGVASSVAFIASLITGKQNHVGPLVPVIRASAKRMGIQMHNRSDEERAEDIEEMVQGSGLRVYEVRFGSRLAGNCIYRPGTGLCQKGCLARWVMPAPLWSVARPDICWECQNLAVSEEHAPFWLARLESCQATYEMAQASNEVALALLSRERIAQCAMILGKLGIEVPKEIYNG